MSPPSKTDSGRDRRKFPRCEVSLPLRLTPDGKRVLTGLALSLGPDGMFVQSGELLPVDTVIRIEISLGSMLGVLRCAGSVVYHNRRAGTEIVTGLGVQFKDLPSDLQKKIESFIVAYPGPVALDPAGAILWPLGKVDPSKDEAGEKAARRWDIEPEPTLEEAEGSARLWATGSEAGGPESGRSVAAFLEILRSLPPGLTVRPDPGSRVPASFRGRRLAPVGGVLARWLAAAAPLEETSPSRSAPEEIEAARAKERPALVAMPDVLESQDEPGPLLSWVLATQMRVIDTLGSAGWRLEHVTREHVEALVEGLDMVNRERLALEPLEETLRGKREGDSTEAAPAVLGEARTGLATVERFLWRLTSNIRLALAPEERAPEGESGPVPGEGEPATRTAVPEAWFEEGPGPSEPKKPKPRKERRAAAGPARSSLAVKLAAGLLALLAVLGTAAYGIADYVRSRPPASYRNYLPTAHVGLQALKAGDRSTLKTAVSDGEKILGAEASNTASLAALSTGLDALNYLHLIEEVTAHPMALGGKVWGSGRKYGNLEVFLQWQGRNASIAKVWLAASEDLATKILESRRPFKLDRDPSGLSTIMDGADWLKEHAKEISTE